MSLTESASKRHNSGQDRGAGALPRRFLAPSPVLNNRAGARVRPSAGSRYGFRRTLLSTHQLDQSRPSSTRARWARTAHPLQLHHRHTHLRTKPRGLMLHACIECRIGNEQNRPRTSTLRQTRVGPRPSTTSHSLERTGVDGRSTGTTPPPVQKKLHETTATEISCQEQET